MEIQIITTGGTIDKLYFDAQSEFQVGDPQVVEVLREAHVTIPYAVRQLMRKDSLDLTDADRRLIRETIAAAPHRHFVVTHGTDTMLDTARVLQTLGDKTIVLTGAMQPARFRFTDAVFNIGCAVMAVQLLPPGVYVTMNGRIFDPRRTVKNREQNRFESQP
ncbi:MAG TPA: asparaginase domain-containing protein [Desulfobacterales bacterium]|nr:asparaginase domain-containing protein [Desulfobacterales bacterium]